VTPPYRRIVARTIPVHVSTNVTKLAFETPKDQSQVTGLVQQFVSATSNVSALEVGTVPLVATYDIYGELYLPNGWNQTGTGVLEFVVHGVTLDHNYFLIGGPGSEFNYVESSVRAGNAIFIFDRLGSGLSSKPDGIKEVQSVTHLAVIDSLLSLLRAGNIGGISFKTIVGVGHSFGSILLGALVADHPEALDALALTGFTEDTRAGSMFNAGYALTIASQADPARFGFLSNSYMTTGGSVSIEQSFMYFPAYPPSAFQYILEHTGIMTIGEFLTRGDVHAKVPVDYVGPVLVLTGDKDIPNCFGNCYQALDGYPNLLEAVRASFPNVSDFQTFIPAETGHCFHAHYSAPQSYDVMHTWISRLF